MQLKESFGPPDHYQQQADQVNDDNDDLYEEDEDGVCFEWSQQYRPSLSRLLLHTIYNIIKTSHSNLSDLILFNPNPIFRTIPNKISNLYQNSLDNLT